MMIFAIKRHKKYKYIGNVPTSKYSLCDISLQKL